MKKQILAMRLILMRPIIIGFLCIPIAETLLISIHISEFYIPLFFIWIGIVFFYNLSSRVTLSLATYYFFFSVLFLFTNDVYAANRLAIWFYLFFAFGMIVYFFEYFLPKKKTIEIFILPTLIEECRYVVFKSTLLFFPFVFCLVVLNLGTVINQVKYFYWFFTFNKFQRYFEYTALYQLVALLLLTTLAFFSVRKKYNFRLVLTIFLFVLFLLNTIIFRVSTRGIQIVGDEPKISEIKQQDEYILIFGHNFRRWPNTHSSIILDNSRQEILFWSPDLIVFKPTEIKSGQREIQLINSLKFKSEVVHFSTLY